MKLIPAAALSTVVVDSTVQEKAIAHPNDARLLEVARRKLVQAAKDAGVDLKQSFAKEGKTLRFKAGRYAHARQFKRLGKTVKRQRTIVASLVREIVRKALAAGQALGERTQEVLDKATRIVAQAAKRKNDSDTPKLYAWHAPEVVCMAKGKSRTPYEFGAKVGIAMTLQHNLIVGARAFEGNPYDGHTLREQLEQAGILRDGPLSLEGCAGRPVACGAVRGGLQPALVAAHDRPQGGGFLAAGVFAPVRGSGPIAELVCDASRTRQRAAAADDVTAGKLLKMNTSGTTL